MCASNWRRSSALPVVVWIALSGYMHARMRARTHTHARARAHTHNTCCRIISALHPHDSPARQLRLRLCQLVHLASATGMHLDHTTYDVLQSTYSYFPRPFDSRQQQQHGSGGGDVGGPRPRYPASVSGGWRGSGPAATTLWQQQQQAAAAVAAAAAAQAATQPPQTSPVPQPQAQEGGVQQQHGGMSSAVPSSSTPQPTRAAGGAAGIKVPVARSERPAASQQRPAPPQHGDALGAQHTPGSSLSRD